jgi:hypothetical protein
MSRSGSPSPEEICFRAFLRWFDQLPPQHGEGRASIVHQLEPDPGEMARPYGPETTVLDWLERLVCSRCGSDDTDMVVTGERR